jgi:NAD-dependent dihydropyrimidine dehydrogenase PreA subunit
MAVIFDMTTCNGCQLCVRFCPGDVLAMSPEDSKKPIVVYPEECFYCGACLVECPKDSITYRIPLPMMLPVYEPGVFD